MKKLCPYCGRMVELGEVCAGCGYVLRPEDNTDNAQKAASSIPTSSQNFTKPDPVAPTVTKSKLPLVKRLNPVVVKIVNIVGWILAIPFFLIGIIGALSTISDYKTGFFSGFWSTLFGVFLFTLGLVILHISRFKSFKVYPGKLLKFMPLIELIVLFVIVMLGLE